MIVLLHRLLFVDQIEHFGRRRYFLNKRSRKTLWSLPSVDEWLAELHSLTPSQLVLPVAGQAARKSAPPPLFGDPRPVAPAVVARQLSRTQTMRATDAISANPLHAVEVGQAEAQHEDDWVQQHSAEHDRLYWTNTRTRQSQWERPPDSM